MFLNEFYIDIVIETLTGTSMELRISPVATVFDVKEKIQHLEGIPVAQQSLVWRSVELENDYLLRDYNIHSGATLRLVLSMRGGPINTRRLATAEEPPSPSEVAEYLGYEDPFSSDRLVIVYHSGDKLSFFRLVDRDTGSALSHSHSAVSDYNPDEDYQAYKQRVEQNHRTRDTMNDLREQMKNLALAKKQKRSMRKTSSRPGSRLESGRRTGSRMGSGPRPGSRTGSRASKRSSATRHNRVATAGRKGQSVHTDLNEAAEDEVDAGVSERDLEPSLSAERHVESDAHPPPLPHPQPYSSTSVRGRVVTSSRDKSLQESMSTDLSEVTTTRSGPSSLLKPLNMWTDSKAAERVARDLPTTMAGTTTPGSPAEADAQVVSMDNTSAARSSSFFNSALTVNTSTKGDSRGEVTVSSACDATTGPTPASQATGLIRLSGNTSRETTSTSLSSVAMTTAPSTVSMATTASNLANSLLNKTRSIDSSSIDRNLHHVTSVSNSPARKLKYPRTSGHSQDPQRTSGHSLDPQISSVRCSARSDLSTSGPLNSRRSLKPLAHKSGDDSINSEYNHTTESKRSHDVAVREAANRRDTKGKLREIKPKRLSDTLERFPEPVGNSSAQLDLSRSNETRLIGRKAEHFMNRSRISYTSELSNIKPLPSIPPADLSSTSSDVLDSDSHRKDSLSSNGLQGCTSSVDSSLLNTRHPLPPVSHTTPNRPDTLSAHVAGSLCERLQASDPISEANEIRGSYSLDSLSSSSETDHCVVEGVSQSSSKQQALDSNENSISRQVVYEQSRVQSLGRCPDIKCSTSSSLCEHDNLHDSRHVSGNQSETSAVPSSLSTLSHVSPSSYPTEQSESRALTGTSEQRLGASDSVARGGSGSSDSVARGGSGSGSSLVRGGSGSGSSLVRGGSGSGGSLVRGGSGSDGAVKLESLNEAEAYAMTGVLNSLVRRGGVGGGRVRKGQSYKGQGKASVEVSEPRKISSISPTDQTSQTVLRILSGGSIRGGGGSRSGSASAVTYRLPPVKVNKKKINGKRCTVCGKKTTLTTGFVCRCGFNFCSQHRYAETHDCTYDYKTEGRRVLERSNPVVTASKLPRI